MGDFETIYRTLTNIRERAFNPVPYINQTLGLSETLTKTYLLTRFYQYGPENYIDNIVDTYILIFYSKYAINHLRNNMLWCIDGTFDDVSSPYKQ